MDIGVLKNHIIHSLLQNSKIYHNIYCICKIISPLFCFLIDNPASRKYNSAFLSVVLITKMLEICIQTSYDQNIQLILKSYLPVVLGTTLSGMLYNFVDKLYIWTSLLTI
jgi:hypothetical protein